MYPSLAGVPRRVGLEGWVSKGETGWTKRGMQIDPYFLHEIWARSAHKEGPIVLVGIFGAPHLPVLIPNQQHNAFNTVSAYSRPSFDLFLHPPL